MHFPWSDFAVVRKAKYSYRFTNGICRNTYKKQRILIPNRTEHQKKKKKNQYETLAYIQRRICEPSSRWRASTIPVEEERERREKEVERDGRESQGRERKGEIRNGRRKKKKSDERHFLSFLFLSYYFIFRLIRIYTLSNNICLKVCRNHAKVLVEKNNNDIKIPPYLKRASHCSQLFYF